MEEAGFAFVRVLVLPRNDIDQQDVSDTDSDLSLIHISEAHET